MNVHVGCLDIDAASAGHRLPGVDKEVQKDLLHLGTISLDGKKIVIILLMNHDLFVGSPKHAGCPI